MPLNRRLARRVLGSAVLAALAPATVLAQAAYPSKPITLIVPFSAGGGVDVTARLLAEKLRPLLGQVVNVENKAGGSGMAGAVAAVRAPADGHTLLLGSAGETAINPHVFKARMQYAPEKDLAPISLVVKVPNVLVVNPALPVKTTAELLAYAKAKPGLSYGTSGIGNPQHLAGELLERLSGQALTHVPYRGASNQLTDTAGGSVDMTFVSLAGARPFQWLPTLPFDYTGNSRAAAIAVDAAGRRLYASNRGHDSIAVLDIAPATGQLSFVEAAPTQGRTPRAFTFSPDGRLLYALNEDSDSIVTFAVDAQTGRLTPTGQSVRTGSPVCMVFSVV